MDSWEASADNEDAGNFYRARNKGRQVMPDKPEDYGEVKTVKLNTDIPSNWPETMGEVLYRWKEPTPNWDYPTEYVLVKRHQFGHVMLFERLMEPGHNWRCAHSCKGMDHLLSVIADKDKALKRIIDIEHKSSENAKSPYDIAEAADEMATLAKDALNQPKEQHGKA